MNRFKTDMHDPAWVLGGRADEDVPALPDNVVPLRPDGAHYGGVYGGPVENAINVAVAYANQANIKIGEASAQSHEATNQAIASCGLFYDITGEAKLSLAAASEISNSERLQAAYAGLNQADDRMREAAQAFREAAQLAQTATSYASQQINEWIGIVTSA
jgi:hypothetical protein